jgi:hypothetical protein
LDGYQDGQDYNGLHWFETAMSTLQNKTFDTIAAISYGDTGNDQYYLYTVNQNGISTWCVWDRILVSGYTVADSRVDLSTGVTPSVSLIYDYDDTPVTDETVFVNGYATSHTGDGSYQFDSPISRSTVGAITLDDVTIGGDNEYGIPGGYWTFSQNGQSTTIIWDKVRIVMSANVTWSYIGYYAQVNATGSYWYDGTTFTGTIEVNVTEDESFDVMYDTVGERRWLATAVSDSLFGLTGWNTSTITITWDAITVATTTYYWTQEDVDSVWMHMSSNVWVFQYDNDPMSQGATGDAIIRAYINGTGNEYGVIDDVGNLYTLLIGPFNTNWYYVNVTLRWQVTIQGQSYDIFIKWFLAEVDIKHTIYIENFEIEPTDFYFWVAFQSNWNNASIIIWDDAINSGTLWSDAIYWSSSEGMHTWDRSTIVGVHNITFLINGSATAQSEQTRDFSISDSWWWYNFSYIVRAVVPEDFDLLTWDIDWQDYHVYVTYSTSWGNSSITPYEDGSPASGTTENYTLQYEKATFVGNHTLDFKIDGGGGNILWKNYTYTISESAAQEGDIRFAFFDTANNWIPFEIVNCTLTYDSTSYVLTSSVATVDISLELNLVVRGRWGELLHNSTFNYTQFKSIVLTVYELTIENEASHPVRIDMSFNGTYPNITMMIPTKIFQRLYVPSANYTVLFTYYSGQYGSDQVINYEEMTGYYVAYNLEVLGLSYIKYTGFSLQDFGSIASFSTC